MSYKPVVVALRRDTQVTLEEQLERVMAPFMPDPDDPRKPSHCDGWRIGGQWTGHFLSRSGDRANLVHPRGFPAESPLSEYVACDGGPKGALDLEYLQRTAEEQAPFPRRPRSRRELRRTGWKLFTCSLAATTGAFAHHLTTLWW